MANKLKRIGFIVFDKSEEWEQALTLDIRDDTPVDGVLSWRFAGEPAFMFETYKSAREAIERTYHYKLAFGHRDAREFKSAMVIVPVASLPSESK